MTDQEWGEKVKARFEAHPNRLYVVTDGGSTLRRIEGVRTVPGMIPHDTYQIAFKHPWEPGELTWRALGFWKPNEIVLVSTYGWLEL